MADNSLNIALPTSVNGVGGSGFNLSYNFGGSTDAIANSAYDFLAKSYSQDTGFVGGSISGAQNFLAHQTAPILKNIDAQESTYARMMPQLFSSLGSFATQTQQNQMQTISLASNYQHDIAIDSISASKKASKKGGLCFITTAVCGSLLLPDDNEYLRTLRAFRDNYMLRHEKGRALVARYYEIAPGLVEKIDARKDSAKIYCYLFTHFILPAVHAVSEGDATEALAVYAAMVAYVEVKANGSE